MRRDLGALESAEYDLLVVGGGLTGACIAYDAAQRGLRCALIERDDFGAANALSATTLIQGGLQALQQGQLLQARRLLAERRAWLRIAPHLVKPLPLLFPQYGWHPAGAFSRAATLVGAAALGHDRNDGLDPARQLPAARWLSRSELQSLAPGLASHSLQGGICWYDAQIQHRERLLLAVLRAAWVEGAALANYVSATGVLLKQRQLAGVRAEDRITGRALEIHARLVINTAGPAAQHWLDRQLELPTRPLLAWGLLTRAFLAEHAIALPGSDPALIAAPWHNTTLLGSLYAPLQCPPAELQIGEERITALLERINAAYPAAGLSRSDVQLVQRRIVPARLQRGHSLQPLQTGLLRDHRADGLPGLLSAIGADATLTRALAQRSVDRALQLLDRQAAPCRTHLHPLPGAGCEALESMASKPQTRRRAGMPEQTVNWLLERYGAGYRRVLAAAITAEDLQALAPGVAILGAELRYYLRREMVHSLMDVILRRSTLGNTSEPGLATLQAVAALLGEELGWDAARQAGEIARVRAFYAAEREQPRPGERERQPERRPRPLGEPRVAAGMQG